MATKDNLSKSADDVRADLEQLKDDLSAVMKSVSRLADNGQRESLEKLREAGAAASAQAKQSMDVAEKSIAQHPLASVLIAFGAGLAIGRLVAR